MIVKNEHHVLRRCLQSVRPLIDTWLIVDTGSTDGTQELARDFFRDLPGELIERPWKNFGHNRTESVALSRNRADYLLIMDADEFLIAEPEFQFPGLTCDAYDVALDLNGITYYRNQLVRSDLPWRYVGVLHEYITCEVPHTQCRLTGAKVHIVLEGARSSDPLKYRRDALVLEEALLEEPSNDRYMFYLAQSYRDAREYALAINRYQRRVEMGGFPEEVWYSRFEIARLKELQGDPRGEVLDAYLQAYAGRPHRAEPLYRIGIGYQQRKEFQLARLFFGQALQLPYPAQDLLFVETDMYQYLLPLEYAVACYWLGLHSEAIEVTDHLLANVSLAQDRREHLLRNRAFSIEAIASCRRETSSS
jgi:tetratricopeptide (TPR) repeat protein